MISYLIFVILTVSFVSTQDIEWESTCVTGPLGDPRIHLENHSDGPIVFEIACANGYFTVYTESKTTDSFAVHFPSAAVSIDQCIISRGDDFTTTYFLKVSANELERNFINDAFNYTYCTIEPGVEQRTRVYSDCEVNHEGLVDYHFVNHRDETLMVSVVCYNVVWQNGIMGTTPDVYEFQISPRSRAVVSIEHYSPIEFNGDQGCVLVPTVFDPFYTFVNTMFDTDFSYMLQQIIFCQERSPIQEPIAEVLLHCPDNEAGFPEIELRADIPAYVVVHCRNGDAHLSAITQGSAELVGTFYQGLDAESCQFYKKDDSLIFSLTIEIGWGLQDRELFLDSKIQTLSCIYDDHGSSRSSVESVSRPLLTPDAVNHFKGKEFHPNTFNIEVLDALDGIVTTGNLASGRQIRLFVTDNTDTLVGFRAYSCCAHNGVTSYTFLINGCGDGLLLDTNEGFITNGNEVLSPFFGVFKLRGGANLWFDCVFTDCDGSCDGSSCDRVGDNGDGGDGSFSVQVDIMNGNS